MRLDWRPRALYLMIFAGAAEHAVLSMAGARGSADPGGADPPAVLPVVRIRRAMMAVSCILTPVVHIARRSLCECWKPEVATGEWSDATLLAYVCHRTGLEAVTKKKRSLSAARCVQRARAAVEKQAEKVETHDAPPATIAQYQLFCDIRPGAD